MRFPLPTRLSFVVFTAFPAAAQVTPGHAIVATEMPSAPRTVLLEVNLSNGLFTRLGRFAFDGNPPLGVSIDHVDRDVIVAIDWQNGTRFLRLPMRGPAFGTPRILADFNAKITQLEFGLGASIFFTTDGPNGGLFALPRNGGTVRQVAALPRARGIFNFGLGSYSGFVVQAGAAGPPAIDPRIVAVNYDSGQTVREILLPNYLPRDVTGLVVLPNAVLNKLVTHADGTVGEVIANRFAPIPLTPVLPAGATRRIRTIGSGFTPYVLGGRAHPHLKTFPGFANGPTRTWTMITSALPGDPVDFDIAVAAGAKVIRLGRACAGGRMQFSFRGGLPTLGNTQFESQLYAGLPNAPATLAIGLSDDTFGNAALPLVVANGCELYTSIDLLMFTRTDGLGAANALTPIPNTASLAGAIVYCQWAQSRAAVLDSSAAAALHLDR